MRRGARARVGTRWSGERRLRGARARVQRSAARAAGALALALLAGGAGAGELPQYSKAKHLGVKTCSGSPCHGNARPSGQVVLQNEHTTWVRRDTHAQAYAVLLEDRSKRIARNLGLKEPAHQAAVCLDCHADNVPLSRRGEQFHLEDGVGCESCHGGAESWLEQHVSGTGDHADNVRAGMYPTDDAVARAKLCVSCHFGDERKFVTHRLMGAGHPRMSFELDTFTAVQPAHYEVDADYTRRGKVSPPAINVWAIGQAVAVREMLSGLADSKRNRDGMWPEFVFFDCHACHHPMQNVRWRPRSSTGLGHRPGVARLNDSSLLMLRNVMGAASPGAGEALKGQTRRLHRAMSGGGGDPRQVARELGQQVDGWIDRLAGWRPDAGAVRSIAGALLDDGINGEYLDYAAAEQAAMALQVLTETLDRFGALAPGQLASLNTEIERILTATLDDQKFQPRSLPPILKRVKATLAQPLQAARN